MMKVATELRGKDLPFSPEIQEFFVYYANRFDRRNSQVRSVDYLRDQLLLLLWSNSNFELKEIYKESSDYYDEDTLEVSHNLMQSALDDFIKDFSTNPEDAPQVIVGFFTTAEDGGTRQYNIISYWYLKESGGTYVIENPFRIDLHPGMAPELNAHPSAFKDTEELVEYWGFNHSELDVDSCSILLATLSAGDESNFETSGSGILNWQTIPERFLEV